MTPLTAEAIRTKRLLPSKFILRGYLTKEWPSALLQCNHDKAEEQLTHLYLSLWKYLFAPIWENRNEFIHGNTGIVKAYKKGV